MDATQLLRDRLDRGDFLLSMGVWDPMSAKLADRTGFDLLALQSFQHAFGLGRPDIGVITPREIVDTANQITQQVKTPLLVDFSGGFGGLAQAHYWVRDFENAGIAALHLDDLSYQRCPYLPGKPAPKLAADVFCRKLETVLKGRTKNIVVVVRSSASAETPEEEVVRLKRYEEAGADVLFVSLRSKETLQYYRSEVKCPLMVQGTAFPPMLAGGVAVSDYAQRASFNEIQELGFQIYNYYGGVFVAYRAFKEALQDLKKVGHTRDVRERQMAFDEILKAVDLAEYAAVDAEPV